MLFVFLKIFPFVSLPL